VLRGRNAEAEKDLLNLRELEENEAARNFQAYEEARSLTCTVRDDILQHEATVQKLEVKLERAEKSVTATLEQVHDVERTTSHKAARLELELKEANARNASVDGDCRRMAQELSVARNELHRAGVVAEKQSSEGLPLQRNLEARASFLESRLQKVEENAKVRIGQIESDAQKRVHEAEQHISSMVADRDRAYEMRAAFDDQDRCIRHLRSHLQDLFIAESSASRWLA
jgi:hypothetical protein